MFFEEAFSLLVGGHRVRRKSWPEDQYLIVVDGSEFQVNRPPLNEHLPEGTVVKYHPHIVAIYQGDDGGVGATDHTLTNIQLFADDWESIDE